MSLGALNVRLRTIMRTPKEAISEILGRIEPITDTEAVPIKEAAGRILSEEVVSDVDLPPFEKSMMDGYAVRSEDTGDGAWSLRKLGESRAGEAFGGAVGPGECIAIYTGAEMPDGADAVVMVERTREDDAGLMHSEGGVPSFQNVAHKGEVLAEGRSVLSAGRRLD
ncbi:MAG: molybdopterin molybdotransferase, partial [Bacteroidia bacterium]